MSFWEEHSRFRREFDEFYSTYPVDISRIEKEMDEISLQHPEWLPYRRKALIYETAAKRLDVQVFSHYPFYYEVKAGRPRSSWGFYGIGAWMLKQPFARQLAGECHAWKKPYVETHIFLGGDTVDLDHHCIGYDNVLTYGLSGLIARSEERLKTVETEREKSFLESTIIANRSLIAISVKFAKKAEEMLADESDPVIRARLERIADSARRVPADPPETFYEALNTILFMREASASLEGIGVSILGHLDRMLYPYYQKDIAEGLITHEEAEYLIRAFLAMTDAKFEIRQRKETSTTVVIGGCDARGSAVFNDVTRMIVEAYKELRLVNPKLNGRISAKHPREYFDLLANLVACGTNVLAVFNDDMVIKANVKRGKAVEDCRLYVAGGCQENMLQNTEINSRATLYLNLSQVLNFGLFPEKWKFFAEREGVELKTFESCNSFDEFYRVYMHNLKVVIDDLIDHRNHFESEGWRFNPCPLHSSTVSDCIANAKDMMEGGTRYSPGSFSLIGIATLIDSLFAIRETVFNSAEITLHEFRDILESNFETQEKFRQFLINRVSKFGQENDEIREFSARVFSDLARVSSGKKNSRGGIYEASLFVYRAFVDHGKKTCATPDGRRAGEYLSQGMSPSVLSLGQKYEIGGVLDALTPLDMTHFPVTAVFDLKLPIARGGCEPEVITSIIRRFLESGGSVLQMNVVDTETLLDAREHPERYPDLMVRVSGYTAYFSSLAEEIQDEIIHRTMISV